MNASKAAKRVRRPGWHPYCDDCVTVEHETVLTPDTDLACVVCGARSVYLGIDYEEYETLPTVHALPKEGAGE